MIRRRDNVMYIGFIFTCLTIFLIICGFSFISSMESKKNIKLYNDILIGKTNNLYNTYICISHEFDIKSVADGGGLYNLVILGIINDSNDENYNKFICTYNDSEDDLYVIKENIVMANNTFTCYVLIGETTEKNKKDSSILIKVHLYREIKDMYSNEYSNMITFGIVCVLFGIMSIIIFLILIESFYRINNRMIDNDDIIGR